MHFLDRNILCILTEISQKFAPKDLFNNTLSLVRVVAWHQNDKTPHLIKFVDTISLAQCKRDVTPVHEQWSCVSFALNHRYGVGVTRPQ